jgi:hypothetical protein
MVRAYIMVIFCSAAIKLLRLCVLSFSLFLSASVFATDFQYDNHKHENHEEDFLFLLNGAYTQEANESEIGINYQYIKYKHNGNKKDSIDHSLKLFAEYGFTDRLQIGFSLPYQQSTWYEAGVKADASSIGNPEVGLSYKIIQETSNLPAVSVGVSVDVGAGSNKEPIRSKEWAYGGFFNASKHIDDWGFIHANLVYGKAENGDKTNTAFGLGFIRPFTDNFSGMIEYVIEKESYKYHYGSEKQTISLLSLGLSYQNNNGLVVGLGYGQSNDDEFFDHALSLILEYEF